LDRTRRVKIKAPEFVVKLRMYMAGHITAHGSCTGSRYIASPSDTHASI
jgi:hypothetical protein